LLAGVGAAFAAMRPFRVEVSGSSMEPTLQPGDWLIATRAGRVRRGTIIVLSHPDRQIDLVKRVSAIPGDVVDGRRLGASEFLVAGDNASASTDGRAFGPVKRHAIEGVVRFRYRPRPLRVR
jgi:nickel-type superoxide dismutase maturation protease